MSNKAQKICIYNRECRQHRPTCSSTAKDSLHSRPTAISLLQHSSENIYEVDRSAVIQGFYIHKKKISANLLHQYLPCIIKQMQRTSNQQATKTPC